MRIRRRVTRVSVTAALTVLTVPSLGIFVPQQAANGAIDAPVRVIGELPAPIGPPKHPQRSSSVVALDAENRRLYLRYNDTDGNANVATYDLNSRIPKPLGSGTLGPEGDFTLATRYTAALDTRRRQLAFVTPSVDAEGHHVPTGTATLTLYSDVTRKVVGKWNLTQRVPGYYPLGITYSAVDDRYYTIGEMTGQKELAEFTPGAGSKPYGAGTSVVAFDAATGDVQFVRSVPECQQALSSKNIGSLIVRSKWRSALYFACVSGGTASQETYPGQAGLVRLTIDPSADTAKAMQLPLEFYAISGSYFAGGQSSGIAAYDGSTDRFYLQSIAYTTPGAFVFDGQLSAWVGFVSAPTNSNVIIGVNEGLGHLYVGMRRGSSQQPSDGLLVADVRQTPVPAGEFTNAVLPSTLIEADPKSRRMFVRPFNVADPIQVVEDLTPETHGTTDTDYDAGTSNLPDLPEHEIFYSLGATGYGAQAVQVGGAGAPFTAGGPNGPKPKVVAPGTRAMMLARVGAVDLRDGGASAGAQSALVDINTTQEYETFDPPGAEGPKPWPYPVGSCLDAGGRPVKAEWKEGSGNTAAMHTLECDLAKRVVKATVRMGSADLGGATVSKAAYSVLAGRNTTEGAIVTTHSYADGSVFDIAGGYAVKLGHVESTSKSVAHGTPGSSYSLWSREVEGVKVIDPTGKALFSGAGCTTKVEAKAGKRDVTDTCAAVAAAVNRLLPTRFRMEFPMPNVEATPKGAFAGVEQTLGQYFQQKVVNDQGVVYRGDSVGIRPAPAVVTETYSDTTERSRTVTVLAATQSNAVFQINKRAVFPPGPGGPGTPPGDPGPGDPDGPGGGGGGPFAPSDGDKAGGPNGPGGVPPQTAQGQPNALPTSDVRGFLFMRRGVRDIALLVLLAGLVFSGFGTVWRRRRLVEVLVTVPGKEAQ